MRRSRLLALLVLIVSAVLFWAPSSNAAPGDWHISYQGALATGQAKTESVSIQGTVERETVSPIRSVTVQFSGGPDACELPPTFEDDEDGEPSQSELGPSPRVTKSFKVSTTWKCNGTYKVVVSAEQGFDSQEFDPVPLEIAAPPVKTMVSADADDGATTGATADDPAEVIVRWDSLKQRYPHDFVGYRVTRTGPGDGKTVEVSDGVINPTATDGKVQLSDQVDAPGRYSYVVESIRSSPSGEVTSTSEPAAVRVSGPSSTTSDLSDDGEDGNNDGDGGGSGVTQPPDASRLTIPEARAGGGSPRSRSGITVPRTPGTVDTGFDEELDYGERPGDSEPGDENALAGEGQSIIRSDEADPGLLGPVAGALVLLGWAGHVAYLNRLARQF